jgi:hypothetical protein
VSAAGAPRQAPTEEEVRELRQFALESARLMRVSHVARSPDWDAVARICNLALAQRDVVAAAQRFLDTLDGERSDGWQAQLALARRDLRVAVAAVVSGTPEDYNDSDTGEDL